MTRPRLQEPPSGGSSPSNAGLPLEGDPPIPPPFVGADGNPPALSLRAGGLSGKSHLCQRSNPGGVTLGARIEELEAREDGDIVREVQKAIHVSLTIYDTACAPDMRTSVIKTAKRTGGELISRVRDVIVACRYARALWLSPLMFHPTLRRLDGFAG
jgi:hypothetical protein